MKCDVPKKRKSFQCILLRTPPQPCEECVQHCTIHVSVKRIPGYSTQCRTPLYLNRTRRFAASRPADTKNCDTIMVGRNGTWRNRNSLVFVRNSYSLERGNSLVGVNSNGSMLTMHRNKGERGWQHICGNICFFFLHGLQAQRQPMHLPRPTQQILRSGLTAQPWK